MLLRKGKAHVGFDINRQCPDAILYFESEGQGKDTRDKEIHELLFLTFGQSDWMVLSPCSAGDHLL